MGEIGRDGLARGRDLVDKLKMRDGVSGVEPSLKGSQKKGKKEPEGSGKPRRTRNQKGSRKKKIKMPTKRIGSLTKERPEGKIAEYEKITHQGRLWSELQEKKRLESVSSPGGRGPYIR